jgi:hypothetical protein
MHGINNMKICMDSTDVHTNEHRNEIKSEYKLSLCFTKHHTIKKHEEVEV